MNALNEIVPGTWRKPLYAIYALIGVIGGAIAVAYGDTPPEWLTVATNVYLFVGGALGLTAAANTDTVTKSTLPGDWSGADSDEVIPVLDDDESEDGFDAEPEGEADDEVPAVVGTLDEDEDDADPEGPADNEALDELAAAEVDDTPPPDDYTPRH